MSKNAEEVEEKVEETEPSNASEAYQDFLDEKSKGTSEEKSEEETCDTCGDETSEESEEATPKAISYPYTINVEGKDVVVENEEQHRVYTQQGYHYSQQMAALKKREEALEQAEGMIADIQQAMREKRLVIKKAGEETAEEEASGEAEDIEPETRIANLEKSNKLLTEQLSVLGQIVSRKMVQETHERLTSTFEEMSRKPEYNLASKERYWQLLGEKDKSDRPKYTPEEAIKISQKEEVERFNKFIEKNPDFNKKTEGQKKEIIADYLQDKKEREKAPVGSPSEVAAGSPAKETKEEEYATADEAAKAFYRDRAASKTQAKKA